MSLTQLIVEGLSGASVATTNGMPACVYIRYMYAVHTRVFLITRRHARYAAVFRLRRKHSRDSPIS